MPSRWGCSPRARFPTGARSNRDPTDASALCGPRPRADVAAPGSSPLRHAVLRRRFVLPCRDLTAIDVSGHSPVASRRGVSPPPSMAGWGSPLRVEDLPEAAAAVGAEPLARFGEVEVAGGDVPAELGQLSLSALLLADGAGGTFSSGRGRGWWLLRVCQIPSSPEGPVELDVGEETVQADLRLGVLGGIETLQRLQDLVVAGETIEIAIVGDLDGLLERLHAARLLHLGSGKLLEGDQAGGNLLEGLDYRLLVLPLRFLVQGLARLVVLVDLAALEERSRELAACLPHRGGAPRQGGELGTGLSEKAGKAQLWEEQRLRHADLGVGGHQLLLDAEQIRAPLQQRGGQASGHGGHRRLGEEWLAARHGTGIASEQDADLILLGGDLTLDLRDGGGGLGEITLGPRRLHLRSDSELQPVFEQIEGVLIRPGGVAGDL